MSKRSKLLKSKFLAIAASAVLAGAAIGVGTSQILNKTQKLNNISNASSNIDIAEQPSTRSLEKSSDYIRDGFASGVFNPNGYGELTVPKGIQASSSYDMQAITPVPGGWIVPIEGPGPGYSMATAFLDQNNNEFKWINYDTNLYQQNSTVIATQYDKATNKVATLRLVNNHELWLYMQDLETGNPVSWKLIYMDGARDKQWFNNQLFDLVPVEDKESTWIMMPRANMNSANRFDSRSKVITYNKNDNSISYSNIPNNTGGHSDYSIVSWGAYYNTHFNRIEIIALTWYSTGGYAKQAFFERWDLGDSSRALSVDCFATNSDNLFIESERLKKFSSRLALSDNGRYEGKKASFLYNSTPWSEDDDIGFYNTIVYSDSEYNQFNQVQWINLNSSTIDVDIINPYMYESKYYGIVTYFNNTTSGKIIDIPDRADYLFGAIELWSNWDGTDPKKYEKQFVNWDKNDPAATENIIKLYTNGLKYAKESSRNSIFAIPSYDKKIWGTFEFNARYYALASALPYNQYTQAAADVFGIRNSSKLGRYAYWTRGADNADGTPNVMMKGPNDRYTIFNFKASGNQSSKSAFDITTTDQLNQVGHYFFQHINPITYKIQEIKNPAEDQNQITNLPSGTKWSYFYYKGMVPAWIKFANVFVEGVKFTSEIDTNSIVGGFKEWTTSLKQGITIDANTAGIQNVSATELKNNFQNSKDTLLRYIRQNVNNLFDDFPKSFDADPNNDITIEIESPNDSARSATVAIHTKKWINEQHELQSGDKKWTIQINNLRGPITCVHEISWTNLCGTTPPTLTEILAGNLDNNVKGAIVSPVGEDFIINGPSLSLDPNEITNLTWQPIQGDRSRVTINFTLRNNQLTSVITGLSIVNTTLADSINANKPNELPSAQNADKLIAILATNKDISMQNLPNGWVANSQNIEITNIRPNNGQGNLIAHVKLKNIESDTGTLEKDVTFTNFQVQPNTDYVDAGSREVDVGQRVITTQFTEEQLKQYIVAHPEQFFVNYPEGLTVDDIALTDFNNQNVASGKITVNIQLKKYFDNTGLVPNGTGLAPTLFTLTGFNTDGLTTTIANTVTFSPVLTFKASDWNDNQNAIKQAIIDARIVDNLQTGKTLTADKITLASPTAINDVTGTITLQVTIDQTVAWVDGNAQNVVQNVVMNGFATQNPTQWASNKTITDTASFGSTFSSDFDEQQIKDYINGHKDQFFTNAPTDAELKVTQISPNIQAGSLTFQLGLTKYFDAQGTPQTDANGTAFKEIFTLSGFRTDGTSTTLDSSDLPVTGADQTLASSLVNQLNNNNPIIEQIKTAVASRIQNAANNQTIAKEDILLTDGDANNTDGSLTVVVTLNNSKYWNNSVVEASHKFTSQPIKVTGFKQVQPTQMAQNTNIQDNASFNQIVASQYGQEQITNYVWDHKDQFFTHEPETLAKTDLVISAISPDNTNGTLQFTLGLKKYNDNQGNEQTSADGSGCQATFILSTFKTSNITTILATTSTVNGVNTVNPNDVNFSNAQDPNVAKIKEAIKTAISNPASPVDVADIELLNPTVNAADGSISVTVKLNNNKYQNEGNMQPSYTFPTPIKLTGFKQVQPTQFANSEVTDASFANIIANVDNYNKTQIKQFIEGHKEKFFTNAPDDLTSDDIVIIGEPQYQTANGKIVFELGLKKWYDQNGRLQTSSDGTGFKQQFTLTGFNVPQTTTLASTNFPISGVSDVNAGSIANLNDNSDQNVVKIKNAIIAQIRNANGNVTIDDIELVNTGVNNLTGTIQAKVKLNNSKYWTGGVTEASHTFPDVITISGFKNSKPTQMATMTRVDDTATFGQIVANQYANEQQIIAYVWSHQAKFYTNAPGSLTEQDLVISAIVPNNTAGTVQFTLGLKKYNDSQGNEQTSTDGSACKQTFTLAGFKTSNITTIMPSQVKVPGVETVNANDVDFNNAGDANVAKIKEAIKNAIQNPASPVDVADIAISNPQPNAAGGFITVSVTLNNNKYQNAGTPQASSPATTIKLTGFKPVDTTNTTTVKANDFAPTTFGLGAWAADFDQNTAQDTVKNYINSNISSFFNKPRENTQVSAITLAAMDNNGFVVATLTFNGNQQGSENASMSGTIRIGKFKQNAEVPGVIDNQVRQAIKEAVEQNKGADQATIEQAVKQAIANKVNSMKNQLPAKLFDPADLTANDINMTASLNNDGQLDIQSASINRLGGINLPTGKFPTIYNKDTISNWLIWVIVGSISALLILLIVLIIAYVIKQKRVNSSTWDISREVW